MSRIVKVSSSRPLQEPNERAQQEQEYDSQADKEFPSSDYSRRALVSGYDDYDYGDEQPPPQRGRAVVLGVSVLLLVAIFSAIIFLLSARNTGQVTQAAVGASASVNTTGLDTAPRTGALAPDFNLLDVHTNLSVKLSSLRGKPVFVNFWGTWCPPCRAEMPEMQRLYDKYPGQLEIVGVSMGPRDYPEQVKNFVDQYKYPWTFIHDPDYAIATTYQVAAIPSSYFIDKNGVIKAVQVGGMNLDIMERNFQLIR